MDKFLLQQQVLERLAEDLLQAEQAVRAAHETATHEENIAENKYDTLGLEAAYLATGQARRAEAIRQAMANWRQFRPRPYDASKGIQLGALVCLVDSDDKQQQLFLGPDGGSMKLVSGAQLVQVISSEAPLGRAMLGKCEGDEVSIQVAPIRQQFEVLRVRLGRLGLLPLIPEGARVRQNTRSIGKSQLSPTFAQICGGDKISAPNTLAGTAIASYLPA
jgi:transcription elongation GreA/GreB family factor